MKSETAFNILSRLFKYVLLLFFAAAVIYLFSFLISTTVVISLSIVGFSLFLFYSYLREISRLKDLNPPPEREKRGKILTLARMIERASKGYDVSREQVNILLSYIEGEDIVVSGEGEDYLKNLKEVIR